MHILSLNAGSATLKFGVFDPVSATPLMEATIERPAVDAAAFDEIERRLRHAGMPAIDAVGHRVAHGGPRLNEAVLVEADVEREIEQDLAHVSWAPRVNLSARTGRHLEKLVPAIENALESWDTRIPTAKFNAFVAELVQEHPHPLRGGKQPRILFGTQVQNRPPTFVLFTTGFLDPGYRRFIQRRLRERYGFEGSPIQLNMRIREKRERR